MEYGLRAVYGNRIWIMYETRLFDYAKTIFYFPIFNFPFFPFPRFPALKKTKPGTTGFCLP